MKRSSTRKWKFTGCSFPSHAHGDLSLSSSANQLPSLISKSDSVLLAIVAVDWDRIKLLLCFLAILRLLRLYHSFRFVSKNKSFTHRNNLNLIFLSFLSVNLG